MKSITRYFFNFSLASLLIVSAGCIQDDFEDCLEMPSAPLNTIGYVSVRFQTSSDQTRAVGEEYDFGINDDVTLADDAKHYAIIYDANQPTPIAIGKLGSMAVDDEINKKLNSSYALAAIVAKDESKEALKRFKDCYVILNTDISMEDLWSKSRDQLTSTIVDSPFFTDKNGKKYLTMCNSVYVDNNQKTIKTEVDTTKIFESSLAALEEAAKGYAAITAYVERLAAKFSLSFENNAMNEPDAERVFVPKNNQMIVFSRLQNGIPYYEAESQGVKYSYRIKITGWGMNALERKSYLFRNFKVDGNYFTNWYNTGDKRVFWSEDLNYNKATYPQQYRKVIDNTGIPVYEKQIVSGVDQNILKNFSFEELNSNKFTSKYIYTPENTYNFSDASFKTLLDNRIEYLAGTHMIVCAEVETNLKDPNKWETGDLWRDRNNNFYKSEKDAFKAMLSSMNQALASHASLKFTYYDWDKGGVEVKLYAKTHGECGIWYKGVRLTPENFDNVVDQMTAAAEFKGSDGKRIIWMDGMEIKDSNGNQLEIYTNIDDVDPDKDEFYRYAGVNDYKSLIFEHVGALDHFSDGKMYYAVPIGYLLDGSNSTDSMSQYTAHGVVRNSEYEVKIHDVTGLGTSVDNVYEPIVPNSVSTKDHLYLSFKIIDWHLTEETVKGEIK